jgi:hypothetical protein
MSTPIGRYELVALDCDDHVALADFYQSIVGGEVKTYDGVADWIELHTNGGVIAFQHAAGHRPPTWPDGDRPQQAHLDIDVDDLDLGEAAVLSLGAGKTDVQPSPDKWRVFIDPAGHPFCLVLGSDPS